MPQIRFRDDGRSIYDFSAEFLVRCPRCEQRAYVTPLVDGQPEAGAAPGIFAPRRCVCPSCGYIQEWRKIGVLFGRAVDWYFELPLWLQTPCCGHTLWAYNADHLAYMEAYVRATLREEAPHASLNRNRTLASRLPDWIKHKENRAEVLKGLARLQRLLD